MKVWVLVAHYHYDDGEVCSVHFTEESAVKAGDAKAKRIRAEKSDTMPPSWRSTDTTLEVEEHEVIDAPVAPAPAPAPASTYDRLDVRHRRIPKMRATVSVCHRANVERQLGVHYGTCAKCGRPCREIVVEV